MALRLIEVFLPAEHGPRLQESLNKDGVVANWMEELSDQQILVRVLLQVENTEPFLDELQKTLEGADFRAVLVPVEATIPRLELEQKEQSAAAASDGAEQKEAPSPRISREELYQQVDEGAQLTRIFVVLVALSAVVAAVGIDYNNITVVIGAMVIAPLLGPNVALALATTLGDTALAKSAAKTNLVGILVALAVAIPIGFLIVVDPQVAEIQSRLHTQLKDVVLALASGAAGVLSITTGASAALIGVMVAVALLPPLVTFGLLVGSGDFGLAAHAMLLFVTNVICVNLAGVVTLLAQNVRPRTWWEADRAKKAIKIAITFWIVLLCMLVVVVLILRRGN
ncbi:MAG TPA: TIGR00341 family protein [Candidatus Binataceae bacterium]|nr:TIGR00341 family protein [Candidatus Binataceae bacterium]